MGSQFLKILSFGKLIFLVMHAEFLSDSFFVSSRGIILERFHWTTDNNLTRRRSFIGCTVTLPSKDYIYINKIMISVFVLFFCHLPQIFIGELGRTTGMLLAWF